MPKSLGWDQKGTKLNSLGIVIAPKMFTLRQRAHLSNGRVVLEGTQYFTWHTACDLISEGFIRDGWRLPTLEEAKAIQELYNPRGKWLLALGLNGFVSPSDMIAYNYLPKDSVKFVAYSGAVGYYWTSSLDKPLYPHVITNTGTHIQVGGSIYLSYGIPMLLVKKL